MSPTPPDSTPGHTPADPETAGELLGVELASNAVDVSLDHERRMLDDARQAVAEKLESLRKFTSSGADELSVEYMNSVVAGAVEKLGNELAVFGRIDDPEVWRIGLYGVERGGERLVIDWRAPFARNFYQASFAEPGDIHRRVSYVGAIDDLLVEDFTTAEVTGSSPLMHELERSRGATMRAAVATLQSEQDDLVRLHPDAQLVIRGGPGTGKTVVGLHRAAWLVHNDDRVLAADLILVIGPSDHYLRFVASVLPTLGEAKVRQTTMTRLLGPTSPIGAAIDWPPLLDRFEASLYRPQRLTIRHKELPVADVADLLDKAAAARLPWRDRRKIVVAGLARATGFDPADVRAAAELVMPSCSARAAWKKLRSPATLRALGLDDATITAWRAVDTDGPLLDELSERFEQRPRQFSHVVVDEAQDLTPMQLRAVQRRSAGLTLVGDDAQMSVDGALGLEAVAERLGIEPVEIRTAYRMSAEIADWLNDHARSFGLPAVELIGIRPTGIAVETTGDLDSAVARVAGHENWQVIAHGEVWNHKGVEYDAVVVDTTHMNPAEIYLAASRAAHKLVVVS